MYVPKKQSQRTLLCAQIEKEKKITQTNEEKKNKENFAK
jgi:hypothetical protein